MKSTPYFLLLYACILLTFNRIVAQECPNQIAVSIEIIPDRAADKETTWRLNDQFGNVLASGTEEGANLCVEASLCLTFTIEDSFGDGLQDYGGFPDGRFSVYYNGELMARNTNFGAIFTIQMGGCALGSSCAFPIPAQTDWVYPAQTPNNWYTFEAQETGRYLLTTCNLTNDCNTAIWVYDYCEGLEWDDTQIGAIFYNDNQCGELAEANMILEQGKIYFIRVGGDESCENKMVYWQIDFEGPIAGCMDVVACNFDPLATVSDESACVYQGHANCPDGPDLVVLEHVLQNSLQLSYLQNEDACAIQEGCLQGYGTREVLRFSTHIRNIGDKDYYLGKPPQSGGADEGEWEWDDCHNHWHYEGYAEYVLYNEAGNELPIGFKNGFCVVDLDCPNGNNKYDCANQGISAGCGDVYDFNLACQWIDITDLAAGFYTLVVRVNWMERPDALGFHESNYHNNWAKVCFELERGSEGQAMISKYDECEAIVDCLGEVYGTASADCSGDCEGNLKVGDRNGDLHYNSSDLNIYLHEILSENLQYNSCTDLNSDGKISIADPALLMACELESSGVHTHPLSHNHCELPTSAIFNPNHQATFSIGELNLDHQYVDVYVLNPKSSILAFELQISGIDIMSAFASYDTEIFELQPFHNSNGLVIGLAYNEKPFAKTYEPTPFFRLYYTAITADDVCIEAVKTVLNQNYEEIEGLLVNACANVDIWSDIEVVSESSNSTPIRVFPNPFSEFAFFDFGDLKGQNRNPEEVLFLMDVNGRIVRQYQNLDSNRIRVERDELKAGVYFWSLSKERGKVVIW